MSLLDQVEETPEWSRKESRTVRTTTHWAVQGSRRAYSLLSPSHFGQAHSLARRPYVTCNSATSSLCAAMCPSHKGSLRSQRESKLIRRVL